MGLDKLFKPKTGQLSAGHFFIYLFLSLANFTSHSKEIVKVDYEFQKIFFVDISKSGNNLIAVGERGIIFSSIDDGKTWKGYQLRDKSTLTSVTYIDKNSAIFVGHRGAAFLTSDQGKSVVKINLPKIKKNDSFLRVRKISDSHIVLVGAWGLFFESFDSGKSWKRQLIHSTEFDRHLYDVISTRHGLLAVGESGTLILRQKKKRNWTTLNSEYNGSFFGINKDTQGNYFLYGMRGKIFKVKLASNINEKKIPSFSKIDTNLTASWMSSLSLKDGSVLFFGDGGQLGRFNKSFISKRIELNSISAGVTLSNGEIFLVGINGGVQINTKFK